ncbi:hypothetical protein AOXY_G26582 [Acipenser oxyrinchus oxyrinchus]|uniref:DNA repair protein SWI5 homolog n=1 Tax=Acipenser oxyrinchus oxyrinchus TaxID=40147 RepID=A0AAD8CS90_ACIOX|nr:hypothetical protein AOXY_G26582 [Acipenser oxyrinchus oxyrinchus]
MDSEERSVTVRGDSGQTNVNTTPWRKGASRPTKGLFRRTPIRISRNLNTGFKSPLLSPGTPRSSRVDQASLREDIEELKGRREELSTQIALLEAEGYSVEELDQHIDQLHEYNDIKDVGQMLLGRLATIRGVTTKDLYGEFGLELED